LLDSFEHVIAAVPVLDKILQECPHVKALVTSRTRLHLQLEHTFTVSPLLPEPAQLQELEALIHCAPVELFAQRARTVLPDFTVSSENVQTIAELCKHLDYLPLAIELAASHSRLFSPQALLARVPQAFNLLRNDLHGIPERHQTLSNAVRWSY